MLREAAYGLFGLITIAFSAEWILGLFDDPREPPHLQPRIPLLGHLMGIFRSGSRYFAVTSARTNADMYTLRIFNTKIYVSNTQSLIPLIQKASKTLSFHPFIQASAQFLGDANPETQKLFDGKVVDQFSHAMRGSLAPGPHLDAQNLNMGRCALAHIDELVCTKEMSLLDWIRIVVVDASSAGVYGEAHPFRDPKVQAAFWEWHSYIGTHMVGLDVTGKGYVARQIVFDAMTEYSKEIPSDAAFLLHERLRVLREAGISEEEAWKQESTFCFAVFPNTSPTMFWALFDIFSRPEILDAIRGELAAEAVSKDGDEFVLDVAAVKTKCHLILSMLQETQRTRGHTAGIRKVVSDTLLDGRYFLKKGNYIQMPTNPLSLSEKLWGPTAKTFDPFRFVPKETRDKTGPTGNKLMAWGFPPHLCPARQFAATEILIIVALLVLRVDLTPATASGKWDKDFPFLSSDTATVPNPLKDIKLRVAPREEGSGSWKLKMGNSMTRISLASG